MITFDTLTDQADPQRPSALTIGSFDGVHKGHQHLLSLMRQQVGPDGSTCVVTFSNHPSHVLKGAEPIKLIYSKEKKLHWLKSYGVDIVYCVPFSEAISSMTYEEFLEMMSRSCPFDHLFLGSDAHLGNKREGTPERVSTFCKAKGIQAQYIDKLNFGDMLVSSRQIRKLLSQGDLSSAVELLGHPI